MAVERSSKRPLRADAARNQARILEAARTVFGAKGLDVSLDEIAHHAGLGVATLYRRFPDRESLVVALFQLELRRTVELATTALAADDPWEGLTTLLRSIFGAVAADKGMRQALLSSRHGLGAATPDKVELIRLLSLIVERAQKNGSLRAGITARDIPPMILMVSVVADFASAANPTLWERYATLLIDGLSARDNPQPLTPDAMSEADMALASSSW
jgi:AcrR family transcriptional regulator